MYADVRVVVMPGRRRTERLEAGDACRGHTLQATTATKPEEVARLCTALSHPLRVSLVALLRASPHGAHVSDLAAWLGRPQSTVSHHLAVLARSGIISRQQHGTWTWCQVVPERLTELREHLLALGTQRHLTATATRLVKPVSPSYLP
jgi:ArsR family transcriptional regulator, arsenate/arsenite/antimonite-responsive transcriptional repressor